MGARKRHQPRRGSLAYSRRVRAKSMEARIRSWPSRSITDEPKILAHCGFKAGCVQIVSIDDREKVPNAGKQLVSLGTVLVTPPVLILGIRGYAKDYDGMRAEFDVYAEDIPKYISKEMTFKNKEGALENAEKKIKHIKEIFAVVAVSPRAAGLEMKKPYIFEAMVSGGDIQKQFTHVKELLGKEIKIDQIFETGATVDVAAITKGHGWQGTMRRWGVKKKQHK
ncbi:MAG TPA: 50S ribosomal protein L3, partial [Nitrosopumilus sp.]|nr:50S ribosomal protein L3 [Nitrosopumilus sp.]